MRRRELLILLSGTALISPAPVRAQQRPMPVIGILAITSPSNATPFVAAIWQGLNETGYVEGKNASGEYRFAESRYDRLPALAAELVSRKVDVLVASGALGTAAAKGATSTIPVVFISADDPVRRGFVASLARPGGNLTGFAHLDIDLTPKLIELAVELVPHAGTVALLVNPRTGSVAESITGFAQQAAHSKAVPLQVLKAGSESEIETAFASLAQLQAGALVVGIDAFFFSRRDQIVALASRLGVPAVYNRREFAGSGGLISYGPSFPAIYRQMGVYAGKILNGAKPADLPVQQPTKFELVINMTAAKAIGLTVPQLLLARADEVIE